MKIYGVTARCVACFWWVPCVNMVVWVTRPSQVARNVEQCSLCRAGMREPTEFGRTLFVPGVSYSGLLPIAPPVWALGGLYCWRGLSFWSWLCSFIFFYYSCPKIIRSTLLMMFLGSCLVFWPICRSQVHSLIRSLGHWFTINSNCITEEIPTGVMSRI